ncbi:M1 family metallopeptidase [Streptomyces sp. BI20]|uniref:M1 family metallopeptidase n=1 Tax=Streptomyces sp. BI20 TaxID=3403460 RepID=UPI003C78A96F
MTPLRRRARELTLALVGVLALSLPSAAIPAATAQSPTAPGPTRTTEATHGANRVPTGPTTGPTTAPATPDRPKYELRLRADEDGTRWTGRQEITFRNAAAAPLRSVDLRLWGNAGAPGGGCGTPDSPAPIRVDHVTGGAARPLTVGCTALRIDLPAPVPRGARATVALDLSITVPDRIHRFGRDGAHRFLGNALPLLAVRDGHGEGLDPDVGFGESFHSLAGDFHVVLDHPSALLVPATGDTVRRPGPPGRTISVSTARGVRDFAWAAGPFRSRTLTSPGGVAVSAYWTAGTPAEGVEASLREAIGSVDALGKRFGRYPYAELDLVMSDALDEFGSMEFPGLVLLWTETEGFAVAHEVAHQWFYGIVGNDQYAEPWLDESFAQYASELYYGDDGTGCLEDGPAWPSDTAALTRSMGYYAQGRRSEYGRVVYARGACALHELERVLGPTAMARMMRGYVRDHWLGVADTSDFTRAAQAATTVDLTPFWREHRV